MFIYEIKEAIFYAGSFKRMGLFPEAGAGTSVTEYTDRKHPADTWNEPGDKILFGTAVLYL